MKNEEIESTKERAGGDDLAIEEGKGTNVEGERKEETPVNDNNITATKGVPKEESNQADNPLTTKPDQVVIPDLSNQEATPLENEENKQKVGDNYRAIEIIEKEEVTTKESSNEAKNQDVAAGKEEPSETKDKSNEKIDEQNGTSTSNENIQTTDDDNPDDVFVYTSSRPWSTQLFLEMKSTEDWWSCWIGFMGFIIVAVVGTESSYSVPVLLPWQKSPWDAFNWEILVGVILLYIFMLLMTWVSYRFLVKFGQRPYFSPIAFTIIYLIGIISSIIGSQASLKKNGLSASIWAIIVGFAIVNVGQLIISIKEYMKGKKKAPLVEKLSEINLGAVEISPEALEKTTKPAKNNHPGSIFPKWVSDVAQAEYYIKISLVLLAIDLQSVKTYGGPGLVVAWVDTPILLVTTFLIGLFILKMSKEEAIVMATAVSVCGGSAAAAAATVIKAESKIPKLVIAVMTLFTVPQIPLLPIVVKQTGMQEAVSLHPMQ